MITSEEAMVSPVVRKHKEILLVEDNPGDARLAQEAFQEGKVPKNIHVVTDGVEAMAFLRRQGPYAGAPRPDLIILDLNLPKKDGREVASEIKADSSLWGIPIVVLTTSGSHADVVRMHDMHVDSYIVKPMDLNQFFKIVTVIEKFWIHDGAEDI